ncbi:hypothetical protein [uncultured Xanthomonas sp.]|uniref:hypothetical protein n=1 Tax=uncultured Xanthomonas sp. TaxID=152831 RepID=UPI0025DF18A1|nr:hypothetical protein [uncultured Xanthomonas sp.]
MSTTNHYHDRIHRATERLAQLQARELLASQRRESKARKIAKREEAQRRAQVADLVFLTGAETLDDAEFVGALLRHMEHRKGHDINDDARSRGIKRLALPG